MAVLKPFYGIRPVKDKVHLIASRSVDTYNPSQLRAKLSENPFTFLHIIKPEFGQKNKSKQGSPEHLQKVKAKYEDYITKGFLLKDQEESLYIYSQTQGKESYTGIIACASIEEYLEGKIKIHEQTIASREEKLMHYLEVCDFNAEPVCLTYPDVPEISKSIEEYTKGIADFDFTTTDQIRHQLWKVSDPEKVNALRAQFEKVPSLYIADGHHRSASSALLAKNKDGDSNAAHQFFMAAFFSESQLKIYDFNRLIKDLGSLSEADFLEKLSTHFIVQQKGSEIYTPTKAFEFSMYLNKNWYQLNIKEESIQGKSEIESLDAALLTEYILAPILNIEDLRTDKRIKFMSGLKGMEGLQKEVDSERFQLAFGLFPATIEQIKSIADHNSSMPPKTTWIEPKFRSGMVIYSLSE